MNFPLDKTNWILTSKLNVWLIRFAIINHMDLKEFVIRLEVF